MSERGWSPETSPKPALITLEPIEKYSTSDLQATKHAIQLLAFPALPSTRLHVHELRLRLYPLLADILGLEYVHSAVQPPWCHPALLCQILSTSPVLPLSQHPSRI